MVLEAFFEELKRQILETEMSKSKSPSVFLRQFNNLRYNTKNPQPDEPEYIYTVTKVLNSISIHVGQLLNPNDVQQLIGEDWTVTITE